MRDEDFDAIDPTAGDAGASPGAGPGAGPGAEDRAGHLLSVITAAIPNGELRPPQEQMCRAVAGAIDSGRHLVVQAGTGTGKSLAYLVPAAASGKKVVIATATLALQNQLAEKDLPSVAASVDTPFRFAVLKGRSNYLCLQRAAEIGGGGREPVGPVADAQLPGTSTSSLGDAGEETSMAGDDLDPVRLADQLRHLLAWSSRTKTGDRADLDFEPHARAWRMVSVGPRECPGAYRCPSGERCFAEQARRAAAEADVIVVNTHLYGAHIASGGTVLPPHDVVVFDEAHEVEGVMTDTLGSEVTAGRIRALVSSAKPLLRSTDGATAVLDTLNNVAQEFDARLRDSVGHRVLISTNAPTVSLSDILERSGAQIERLVTFLRRAEREAGMQDTLAREVPKGGEVIARLTRVIVSAGHLFDDIAAFTVMTTDDVAWVDGSPRSPVLRRSPIDVAPILSDSLWGESTAILTSATIPQHLVARLGLSEFPTDLLDVGSPFDYFSNALLYVARHLPDRRTPEAEPALHEELATLITAAGGRTLALFTSIRASEAAAAAVRERVDLPILLQGDLPKGRLLENFAEDESTCLFATIGFWQGVDVPGRSLSLVTLDRLPFPRPDEPLLQARRTRAGDAAFRVVDLPRAATLLAQGAGRLIRRADDQGVVAVFDPRLATAGYRGILLAAMPPFRRTTDLRLVTERLRAIASG